MTTSFHDEGKLFQLMRHSTKMGTQREQGEEGFFFWWQMKTCCCRFSLSKMWISRHEKLDIVRVQTCIMFHSSWRVNLEAFESEWIEKSGWCSMMRSNLTLHDAIGDAMRLNGFLFRFNNICFKESIEREWNVLDSAWLRLISVSWSILKLRNYLVMNK